MTRLIDADALLEALKEKCGDTKYLKPIVDIITNAPTVQSEVSDHVKSIKIPTDTMEQEFQNYYRRGYQAGKKDVQCERWVSVPTDEMVKVLMVELLKINYLSHPDVPYESTASGDSPDDWHRRVIKHVLTKTLQAAPKDTE